MDDAQIKIVGRNIAELALDLKRAAVMLQIKRKGALTRKILDRVQVQIPGVIARIDDEEDV